MNLKQLEQEYQARKNAGLYDDFGVKSEPEKKKGRGGTPTSLISELTGAGGAAGGAAAGAAVGSVVPGLGNLIGGLIGAGLGGFLGGTGGRAVENKVRDDEFRVGDALKEGALTGALSAVPIGGVGKAVRGVAGAAKTGAKEAAESAIPRFAGASDDIMRGVEELIAEKRIPVSFLDDAGFTAAKKPVTSTTNKLMVNPTVGEVAETVGQRGTTGSLSRYRQPATFGVSEEVPVLRTATTRTDIPVSTGTGYSRAEQVLPKPTLRQQLLGDAESGVEAGINDTVSMGNQLAAVEPGENILTRFGSKLRSNQRGITAGVDRGGGRGLSTEAARLENAAIDKANKGIKGLTLSGQYTGAEKEVSRLTQAYRKTAEAADDLVDADKLDIIGRVEKNIADNPRLRGNLTTSGQNTLDNIMDDIAQLKTKGDFIDYAPKINQMAKSIVEKGNVGSKEVQVIEEIRDAFKTFIDEKIPGKSGVNRELSNLLGGMNRLSKAITRDEAAKATSGLTVGRMAQNVANPALDVAGRGAQGIGRLLGPSSSAVTTPRGILSRGVVSREFVKQAAGGALFGEGSPDAEAIPTEDLSTDMGVDTIGDEEVAQEDNAPFSSASIQAAIIQDMANNEGKNTSTLLKLYDTFGKDAQLSADEKKSQAKKSSALNNLKVLTDLYQKAGGAQSRAPGILGGLLGKLGVGETQGISAYNDVKKGLVAQLARAMGETGVLTDADREYYSQLLPDIKDRPEEFQYKLEAVMQSLEGGGGGADDIESLLQTAGAR